MTPSIIRPTGAISAVNGSDVGRAQLQASDVEQPAALLASLNLIRIDVNEHAKSLSTGETTALYFEDITLTGSGVPFALRHNLHRRVRWSVVDWVPQTLGQACLIERNVDASAGPVSNENTLMLRSSADGIATIRVW